MASPIFCKCVSTKCSHPNCLSQRYSDHGTEKTSQTWFSWKPFFRRVNYQWPETKVGGFSQQLIAGWLCNHVARAPLFSLQCSPNLGQARREEWRNCSLHHIVGGCFTTEEKESFLSQCAKTEFPLGDTLQLGSSNFFAAGKDTSSKVTCCVSEACLLRPLEQQKTFWLFAS